MSKKSLPLISMCIAMFSMITAANALGAAFEKPATREFLRADEIVLNEIIIAPPGNDWATGCEYVEFRGTPGVPIGDFTYLDLEGDREQNPGVVNYVFNLRGVMPGSNGIVLIASNSNCRTFDSQSRVIFDFRYQSFYSSRNNGTNSFVILKNAANYQQGQDLDGDNNGLLDSHPTGSFDGIAVYDGSSSGDIIYNRAILPRRPNTPTGEAVNAATRFRENTERNLSEAFYYGDLCTNPRRNTYRPTILGSSINFPSGGRLTPGGANVQ